MTLDLFGRLALALLVGGMIGAERESRDKAAGFRTMTLICLGSAMFTEMSIEIGGTNNAARIAAQIVSGVGFLGAGVIMRDGVRVTGLTTAATVWLTASLGMGLGAGYVAISLVGAGLTLLVLLLFPIVENQIDLRRESITYTVTCGSRDVIERLRSEARASKLRVGDNAVTRDGTRYKLVVSAVGSHDRHAALATKWLDDPQIDSLSC